MKTKISLEQTEPGSECYRVVTLTNRVSPQVGTVLTRAEVETLLSEDDGKLTISIRKSRG